MIKLQVILENQWEEVILDSNLPLVVILGDLQAAILGSPLVATLGEIQAQVHLGSPLVVILEEIQAQVLLDSLPQACRLNNNLQTILMNLATALMNPL